MSELLLRALTGAVYVVLTLLSIWSGGFTVALLFLPVCLIAADEFHRLFHGEGTGAPRYWHVLLAGSIYLAVAVIPRFAPFDTLHVVALWILLLVLSLIWMMYAGTTDLPRAFAGILLTSLYITVPFALLPAFFTFGSAGNGPEVLVGLFALLWTNDTGAYLVGRAIGKHGLAPAISPKKTIEGLLGGLLLALVVAYLLWRAWPVLSLQAWLGCGGVISISATVGDLFESALKRARGVKDSGTVLPGHGGILDRFDGLLLASPCLFVFLELAD